MDIYDFADEWEVNMEQWWNGTDRGKLKYSERKSPSNTLSRAASVV